MTRVDEDSLSITHSRPKRVKVRGRCTRRRTIPQSPNMPEKYGKCVVSEVPSKFSECHILYPDRTWLSNNYHHPRFLPSTVARRTAPSRMALSNGTYYISNSQITTPISLQFATGGTGTNLTVLQSSGAKSQQVLFILH